MLYAEPDSPRHLGRLNRPGLAGHSIDARREAPMNRLPEGRLRDWGGIAALLVAVVAWGCASMPERPPATPGPQPDAGMAARELLVTFRPPAPFTIARAGSSDAGYGGATSYRVDARTHRLSRELARDYGLVEMDQWPIRALGVECVVYRVPEGRDRADLMRRLAADGRVDSVEEMHLFASQATAPGDPYLGLQHDVTELGLEQAHRWSTGAGVRVAVIDTGVDVTHPELAGRIAEARDFVAATPSDHVPAERHGTAVAGLIASRADNGVGIVGVAPDVRILALRACWEEAPGAPASCSSFTLAKAIAFALDAHPAVMNLSLAGPWDPLLERLLRVALDRGVLVVAARGGALASFPSGMRGVLAVSAWPATSDPPPLAEELSAPGQDVLTTVPGGAYDFLSGSSLAAAEVSGVAALTLQRQHLSPTRLYELLRETARPSSSPTTEPPRVDACAAVARLVAGAGCS